MSNIAHPWHKFLLSAEYPIEMIYTGLEDLHEKDIPPQTHALIHWDGLYGEVYNGGLGQWYFNHAQMGASFVGLDKEMAIHPLLDKATVLMQETLERYQHHADALGITRESGEWPSEFFDRVSTDCKELEQRILAEQNRLNPLLSMHILQSPQTYWHLTVNGQTVAEDFTGRVELEPSEDEGLQRSTLLFKNGFPHGPNLLNTKGSESVVSIAHDFSQIQVQRTNLKKVSSAGEFGPCSEEIKNFKTDRKSSKKYSSAGTLLNVGNRTLSHRRIGEQWEYFESGNLKEYQYFSHDYEHYALSRIEYYEDGSILKESHRDIDNPILKNMKTYWPNGQLNTVIFGGASIDNWEFQEAYDDNGNSLLDGSKSGELRYAICQRSGEAGERRADIDNGRFTQKFWK